MWRGASSRLAEIIWGGEGVISKTGHCWKNRVAAISTIRQTMSGGWCQAWSRDPTWAEKFEILGNELMSNCWKEASAAPFWAKMLRAWLDKEMQAFHFGPWSSLGALHTGRRDLLTIYQLVSQRPKAKDQKPKVKGNNSKLEVNGQPLSIYDITPRR